MKSQKELGYKLDILIKKNNKIDKLIEKGDKIGRLMEHSQRTWLELI